VCDGCWKVTGRRERAEQTLFPKTYFGQRDRKSNFSVRAVAATIR
jgi:hypothetical protein